MAKKGQNDCECECVCSYIFMARAGHKNHHNEFVFVAYAGKAPAADPLPPHTPGVYTMPPTLAPLLDKACAEPFMKPFRGHISFAVLISLLVIIVVVIKNENNKIIKPGPIRIRGNSEQVGQSSIDSDSSVDDVVQKAKLLNFVPVWHFKCVCAHFNFPVRPAHVFGPIWALFLGPIPRGCTRKKRNEFSHT